MNKKVSKIQLLIYALATIQIVLVGAFVVLYFLNIFNLQNLLEPMYIVLGGGAMILISCIIIFVVSSILINMKAESEIHTADILSTDIQEVYNFAETAIVITDEKNIVIWESELFQNRRIDLFGVDIFQKFPSLSTLKDAISGAELTKVEINRRTYEVKFISETGVWIFKDISDFETAYNYSISNAVVFGNLVIDNYEYIISKGDILNDIDNELKSLIQSYFNGHGCLIRKIGEDTYFLVTSYEKYMSMRDDKFSIIDKVRKLGARDLAISLSVGFAYDFPDLVKLNKYAANALDLALSRGGDQVVVFPYGREIEFYGGKAASVERTNKVKMRSVSESILSLIKDSSNIVVMGHTNMDMDAFGACLGFKAIADRCEKPVKIVVDFKATEKKTRSAIMSTFSKREVDELFVTPKHGETLVTPKTLVVVLDVHAQKNTMAPDIIEIANRTMVIDHHRRGKDTIENSIFTLIDPGSTSTSELITEIIKYCPINPVIELPSTYATFMLSGIFLDSTYFKSNATSLKSFEAAAILKDFGANNSIADDYLKDDYQEHQEISAIVQSFNMPFPGVALAFADDGDLHEAATYAKVSNEILTFKGVHAVFAFGRTDGKTVRVSARSNGTINVQLLTEKLGGGGSFSSAAVVFKGLTVTEAKDKILECLKVNLPSATAIEKIGKEE